MTKLLSFSVFVLIALASFTSNTSIVSATSPAYGWFASKVEYVDSSTTCASNEASIEYWLVESGTENLLSNSIGFWSVNVRDPLRNRIGGQNMNGQKQSGRVCFDPVVDGLQVVVTGSSDYRSFTGPTVFPSATDVTVLDSMRGNHFRGYVQLESLTASPSVESISPNGSFTSDTPTFEVRTNSLTSQYNPTQVVSTRIYALNQITNELHTISQSTPGGVGSQFISGLNLPDGRYFWTFHQELDGSSVTNKYTAPARVWNFAGIPASGVPGLLSFTVDTTPPTSNLINFTVSPSTPVVLEFENDMSDSLSGIANSIVYVEDSLNNPLQTIIDNNFFGTVTSSTTAVTVNSLVKGETYNFYSVTTDNAGNTATTTRVQFTIPLTLSVPQVSLYTGAVSYGGNAGNAINGVGSVTHQHAYVYATVTDKWSNPSPLTGTNAYRQCWATSSAALSDTAILDVSALDSGNQYPANCRNRLTPWSNPNYFYTTISGLPSNETIYFRLGAENDIGWGYSSIGSFNTSASPYDATAGTPSVPSIEAYTYGDTSNSLLNFVRITHAGFSPINQRGVCYSTDETTIDNFDPGDPVQLAAFDLAGACELSGPLPQNYTIPTHVFYTYAGLVPNTTYYSKAFAINDTGVGFVRFDGTTEELIYDFRHQTSPVISPRFVIDELDFNETTNQYDEISIITSVYDYSSEYLTSPNLRSINYLVELDADGDAVYESQEVEVIDAQRRGSSAIDSIVKFNNVPLGNISVRVTINTPENYPELATAQSNNVEIITTELVNPSLVIDVTSGSDSNTGGSFIVDPLLFLDVTPSTVRVGESTSLTWSMLNTPDVTCEIQGPDNFATDGVYSITSYDNAVPIGNTIAGSVPTNVLSDTQVFRFECRSNATTDVFVQEARVKVVGTQIEL